MSRQLYFPDTAILITRFMTPDGVGEVTDFMPVTGSRATSHHRLVRLLRVVRGSMRFVVDVKPRFDYGRQEHHLEVTEEGAIFHTGQLELTLHSVGSLGTSTRDLGAEVERMGNDLRIHRTLQEGESAGMVLESGGGRPRRLPDGELERLSDETAEFWRGWLRKSTYTGRWREMVTRSAMTLKLMTYAPSGALVAAPTTGLPEQVGGERNWDYRYTWIRDASFSVHALLGLGYAEEAAAFGVWVRDRLVEHKSSNGECPLRIMYRVDGSSDLTEETLDHWEGWRGSRPVRIGNGASDQLQLDIFGEAMDAFAQADEHGLQAAHVGWTAMVRAGPYLPAGHGARLECQGTLLRPALRHRGAGLLAAADAADGFVSPFDPMWLDTLQPWTRSWSQTAWCTATTPAPRPMACAGRRARSRCARSGTWTRWPGRGGWRKRR